MVPGTMYQVPGTVCIPGTMYSTVYTTWNLYQICIPPGTRYNCTCTLVQLYFVVTHHTGKEALTTLVLVVLLIVVRQESQESVIVVSCHINIDCALIFDCNIKVDLLVYSSQ